MGAPAGTPSRFRRIMARLHGLLGLVAIIVSAYLFSTERTAIQSRVVVWGLVLQFVFAFLVLKTGFGKIFYGSVYLSTRC